MSNEIRLQPIGWVRAARKSATDNGWDAVEARIELDAARFGPEALKGLDQFSHVEVLFLFHRVEPGDIETGARRPRGNPAWPEVGIFAQRGRNRPNRIGATICRILSVDGTTLHVQGLDAIDGTPAIDIKPAMSGFLPRGGLREPSWAKELMARYW